MTRSQTHICYVTAFTAAALIAMLAIGTHGVRFEHPGTTCWLVLFSFISARWKVVLPGLQGNLTGSFLFTIFAIQQLDAPEALVVSVGAVISQTVWKARTSTTGYRFVFNISCIVITVILSWWGFHWVVDRIESTYYLGVTILLGAIYFLINSLLVSLMIAAGDKKGVGEVWQSTFLWTLPLFALGSGLVAAIGKLTSIAGPGGSLLIGPLIILIHRYHSMKVESLQAAEERLEMANDHIREMSAVHMRTIEALALAIEAKDQVTGDHLNRVRLYCQEIGRLMGLSELEMPLEVSQETD